MTVRSLVSKIWRDYVWRLITMNLIIFVVVRCAMLHHEWGDAVLTFLILPASPAEALEHFYGILLYMYTQVDIWHLIFNMVWLWCFGTLASQLPGGGRRMAECYILGGFGAAAAYILLGAAGIASGFLLGSSASVLAIVGYTVILAGSMKVRTQIIGELKIRWIAVILIVLTLIPSLPSNYGELGAHLAGLATGVIFAFAVSVRRVRDRITPRRNPRSLAPLSVSERAELDGLLTRISRDGFASLAAAERSRLFELSQRSQRHA